MNYGYRRYRNMPLIKMYYYYFTVSVCKYKTADKQKKHAFIQLFIKTIFKKHSLVIIDKTLKLILPFFKHSLSND